MVRYKIQFKYCVLRYLYRSNINFTWDFTWAFSWNTEVSDDIVSFNPIEWYATICVDVMKYLPIIQWNFSVMQESIENECSPAPQYWII